MKDTVSTFERVVSRRTFIQLVSAAGLSGVAGISYMRLMEPFWFEVTEKRIQINRFQEPLRILHLSDFHASDAVPYGQIERAVDLGLEQQADIAFLTGDFITSTLTGAAEYQRILRKLSDCMPTFACIGNHDGGGWSARTEHGYKTFHRIKTLLTDSGIQFLFNQQQRISCKGQYFTVAGLGDYWSNDTRPEQVLDLKSEGAPERDPVFVLSHNPDSKSLCLNYEWDVMCCGHTHGGQLVVPWLNWRPFVPIRDTTCSEGIWSKAGQYVHVTRGVGNLHGMRFNCRPEISVLHVT